MTAASMPLRRAFVVTVLLVLCSSFLLANLPGYGTLLSQFLVLSGWGLISALTSPQFADTHPDWALLAAALLNTIVFVIPALLIRLLFRSRNALHGVSAMIIWLLVYMACVFLLFPARDGP